MAANFWSSTQCKQLIPWEETQKIHYADAQAGLSVEDSKKLKIYFSLFIRVLAQHIKLRQRVVATAIAYFRRVYLKKPFIEYDPRLVAPTCLYLSSKAEECTSQAKVIVFYSKQKLNQSLINVSTNAGASTKAQLPPLAVGFPFEVKDVLEMEMRLLEVLDYHFVVFHPYRTLSKLLADVGLTNELMPMCWSIINDSYKTDLILAFPPYAIALGSVAISATIMDKDIDAWMENLNVDIEQIKKISLILLEFYEKEKNVSEEDVVPSIHKLYGNAVTAQESMASSSHIVS